MPGTRAVLDTKVLGKEYVTGGSGRSDGSRRVKTADVTKIPGSVVTDSNKYVGESSNPLGKDSLSWSDTSMAKHIPTNPYIHPIDQGNIDDIELFGGKAAKLGLLARTGLPVPKGFCINTEAYNFFITYDTLPENLIEILEDLKADLGGKVALRSSATCEDSENRSMAGIFQSYYLREKDSVQEAIAKIYAHMTSEEVTACLELHGIEKASVRMGLIMQELIEPELAGVMYTGLNAQYILIQYIDGFGARLVDGETHGSAVLLDAGQKRIVESMNYELLPLPDVALEQLLFLVEMVKHTFGKDNHDIEFAYRDEKVFLLQARPLTTALTQVNLEESVEETLAATKRRLTRLADDEQRDFGTVGVVFSNSNFAELLPRPAEMDFGIFAYIFTGLEGRPGAIQLGRREMGYLLGEESIGFMHYIGGKPYFSIARDAATFYIGFPAKREEYFQTLINEYLSAIQDDPKKGEYPEMGLYLQDPELADLQVRYSDKASAYYQIYQDFLFKMESFARAFEKDLREKEIKAMIAFANRLQGMPLASFSKRDLVEYIHQVLEHLRTVSCVHFVKATRLGFYFSQRLQLELQKKLGLEGDELALNLGHLLQGLEGSMTTDANIAIAEASSMEEALALSSTYDSNGYVGHYSASEILEIRHKRYKDEIDDLKSYVYGIRYKGEYKSNFHKQMQNRIIAQKILLDKMPKGEKEDVAQTIASAQTYMALRETVKYYFTREYVLLRDALELLEDRLDMEEGNIYYLYPKELFSLIKDEYSMRHIIRSRRQAFDNYPSLELPVVIRASDIDSLTTIHHVKSNVMELRGKFLAEGESTEGIIVNLDSFMRLRDAEAIIGQYNEQGIPVILAATQINLGHDPLIMLAAGLAIENAGIVSHGAQRARELGRGAIGGIKSKYLKTGDRVYFDLANKIIRKLE